MSTVPQQPAIAARARKRMFAYRAALWGWVLVACAMAASTYSVFSHTWDEPEHIAAGLVLLDKGQYPYDVQHPPLARIAMALGPYLAGAHSYGNPGPSGEQEGRDVLYRDGQYDRYLTLARIGMLPFLALLIVATWLWTRHTFGSPQALIAVFFVVTTPPLIGHAAVAALDVPMAATSLLALYLLQRWFDRPRLNRAVVFGAAAGIAIGTKLSAIPFLGVAGLAWLTVWLLNRRTPHALVGGREGDAASDAPTVVISTPSIALSTALTHAAAAAGVAAVALICCYGFGLAPLSAALPIPVPVGIPRFIDSLTALAEHNSGGHLSYFMGELRRTGWWQFYLVALGVKTPLPLLTLSVGGLTWLSVRAWRERRWQLAAPALAFAAILIFSSAYSHINIGVRHVMLLFPLMAIGASAAVTTCWRLKSQPWAKLAVAVLLAWQVLSVARAHPDYLAYFNEVAGDHPERILVDSDLDWGQDIRRLEIELNRRHITEFGLIYRGTADLPHENLPHYRRLWPQDRATGWVAVSLLAKLTAEDGDRYHWLDAYQPVMRIGKSIDLYYIEPHEEPTPK